MSEFEVIVFESDIIVNRRGTRSTITFARTADAAGLVEKPYWTRIDQIDGGDFRSAALAIAIKTAKKLGLISKRPIS